MKPTVFIGSSSEARTLANAVQEGLDTAECTVWTQGAFNLSEPTIDDLRMMARDRDFAVFVFSPDDITNMRGMVYKTARDNVILESGLFMGRYGRKRVFVIVPKGGDLHIPSDLVGLTMADYDPSALSRNPVAALGTACNRIKRAIALEHETETNALKVNVRVEPNDHLLRLKVNLDITNRGQEVLIKPLWACLAPGIIIDPKADVLPPSASGQPRYVIRMFGKSVHDREAILVPRDGRNGTYIALDPNTYSEGTVKDLLNMKKGVAEFFFRCYWFDEYDSVVNWRVAI